jgi:hypothetical protein
MLDLLNLAAAVLLGILLAAALVFLLVATLDLVLSMLTGRGTGRHRRSRLGVLTYLRRDRPRRP